MQASRTDSVHETRRQVKTRHYYLSATSKLQFAQLAVMQIAYYTTRSSSTGFLAKVMDSRPANLGSQ